MLHPILETLFFLKIARESVCDSIRNSNVDNKSNLISYIRNEASDYEVMHLLTIGEMPEEKFNVANEAAIWGIFKEAVILEAANLKKSMLKEDIMNIVYEMGPVSPFGYSSAAPILEFDRANGRLDLSYLREDSADDKESDARMAGFDRFKGSRRGTEASVASRNAQAGTRKNVEFDDKKQDAANTKISKAAQAGTRKNVEFDDKKQDTQAGKFTTADRIKYAGIDAGRSIKNFASNPANQKAAGYAAAGAVGAAGLYGLYKLYKAYKAKKAAAKTPEAKAAAAKGMAATQAKIKAKKGGKKK